MISEAPDATNFTTGIWEGAHPRISQGHGEGSHIAGELLVDRQRQKHTAVVAEEGARGQSRIDFQKPKVALQLPCKRIIVWETRSGVQISWW